MDGDLHPQARRRGVEDFDKALEIFLVAGDGGLIHLDNFRAEVLECREFRAHDSRERPGDVFARFVDFSIGHQTPRERMRAGDRHLDGRFGGLDKML